VVVATHQLEVINVDESWLSRRPLRTAPAKHRELRQRVAAEEKQAIEAALKESRGRVFGPSGAAAKLGIAWHRTIYFGVKNQDSEDRQEPL
jgi:hypothetical protein